MSRSIKKGPFVAPELYKRVEELHKAGEKKVLKTCPELPPSSPPLSVIPSLSTTAVSMFPSISLRIWLDTSWASSFRPVLSVVTPAARPPIPSKEVLKWKLLHM